MNIAQTLAKHDRSDAYKHLRVDFKSLDKECIINELNTDLLKQVNIVDIITTLFEREDVYEDIGLQLAMFDSFMFSKRNDLHLLLNISNFPSTLKLLIETHLVIETAHYPEAITDEHIKLLYEAKQLSSTNLLVLFNKYAPQLQNLSIDKEIMNFMFGKLKDSNCYDYRKGIANLSPYIVLFGKKNIPIEIATSSHFQKTLSNMSKDGEVALLLDRYVGKDLSYIQLVTKLGGNTIG